jgi:hypothetical protein
VNARGLVLFPGAGSSALHAALIAIEQAVAPLPVARIDFPYRKAGKKFPDKAPVLVQCVKDEVRLPNKLAAIHRPWSLVAVLWAVECAPWQMPMSKTRSLLPAWCALDIHFIHRRNPNSCALHICQT